jgi:O-antigen ligase
MRRPARLVTSPPVLTTIVIVAAGLLAAYAAIVLAGTKTGVALAVLAVAGPITAYAALTQPLVFPFSLYVLLVPFDNLLDFSSFGTLTKLLGAMCGAALVLWLVRHRKYVVPDRALLAWGAFVMVAVASATWALDPTNVTGPLLTLIELYLLYAVLSFAPVEASTLRIVVQATILSGTIAAAYGAYLFHRGIDVSASAGRLFLGTTPVADTGSHIDPNHFAASLLLPIALALVAVIESRRAFVRIVAALCLLALGAGIAVASSRGAFVAIVAMLIYLLIRSRKRLLIAGVAIASLGVAIASYSNVIQRFGEAAATGGAGRLEIWKIGLASFLRHPLLGAGFGNFPIAYNRVFLTVSITKNMYWGQAPHSNVVWVAVELGLLGLAAFLYAWWAQYRSLRSIGPDNPLHSLRIGLEAALVAIFVASLFLGTLTYKYLWLVFMLMALTRSAAIVHARTRRPTTS